MSCMHVTPCYTTLVDDCKPTRMPKAKYRSAQDEIFSEYFTSGNMHHEKKSHRKRKSRQPWTYSLGPSLLGRYRTACPAAGYSHAPRSGPSSRTTRSLTPWRSAPTARGPTLTPLCAYPSRSSMTTSTLLWMPWNHLHCMGDTSKHDSPALETTCMHGMHVFCCASMHAMQRNCRPRLLSYVWHR
jgi:hypothetical protein